MEVDQPNKPQDTQGSTKLRNKKAYMIIGAVLVIALGVLLYLYLQKEPETANTNTNNQTTTKDTTTKKPNNNDDPLPDCAENQRRFANNEFGAKFCYPMEWGNSRVIDAKVGDDDTGYREIIRFSDNPMFVVGGVSDDWSTTVGRDTGCQEPNNNVPELSDYDTNWHNLVGTGDDVEFAMRSLPSSVGGYDMSEEVSNLLSSGVCAQGHKVINGSRYRVVMVAFYRDFAEASGIKTPRLHMDNPEVLFSIEQRQQLDSLLLNISAY